MPESFLRATNASDNLITYRYDPDDKRNVPLDVLIVDNNAVPTHILLDIKRVGVHLKLLSVGLVTAVQKPNPNTGA